MKNKNLNKAFTLIELLIVITIIGLLASLVMVSVGTVRTRARDAKRIADMNDFQKALALYASLQSGNSYPVCARQVINATTDCLSAALISGRRLTRSVAWNLAAQLLPLAVAVVCIPLIIGQAGVERFGVLTLAWALIGYSGMFDLGLGRALTKLVAERLGSRPDAVRPLVTTGLAMMLRDVSPHSCSQPP